MLTVCTFLWFDPHGVRNPVYIYNDDHVRAVKQMVKKHLKTKHEFICVSDHVIDGVTTIPLDMTTHVPGTRYAKLMMYRPDGPLVGKRLLYLDLDCIVTKGLDPLIKRDEDLVLWRNPNFGQKGRARYNTSMILHTCGTRPEIWTDFDPKCTPQHLQKMWGGTDQAWVSHRVRADEAHWTDKDGVYGAGRLGDVVDGAGTELPKNARVVFTPGEREPTMPHMKEKHPWIAKHHPMVAA